jgi:hypothetical protein
MEDFEGDNEGYLKWIAAHPNGYVLNLGVRPHTDPNPRINQMLHRATCRHIRNARTSAGPTWKKVCSLDKQELLRYGEQREGQVAAFCYTCRP